LEDIEEDYVIEFSTIPSFQAPSSGIDGSKQSELKLLKEEHKQNMKDLQEQLSDQANRHLLSVQQSQNKER